MSAACFDWLLSRPDGHSRGCGRSAYEFDHFLCRCGRLLRGGLHYVLVGAMYLVSGISGSKASDMAAVAPVLLPEMKPRGGQPRRSRRPARGHRRTDRNHSAKPCPDYHRFGDGRFDLGAVRRPVAGRGAGHYAMLIILAMGIGLFARPFE